MIFIAAFPLVKHRAAYRNRTDDLFITRVIRGGWTWGYTLGGQRERCGDVRGCPGRYEAIDTQIDTPPHHTGLWLHQAVAACSGRQSVNGLLVQLDLAGTEQMSSVNTGSNAGDVHSRFAPSSTMRTPQ